MKHHERRDRGRILKRKRVFKLETMPLGGKSMVDQKKPPYILNILIDQKGEIYISKRNKELKIMPGLWQTVCRKTEENESSVEACERETNEETGLKITAKRIRKIFNDPEYNCRSGILSYLLWKTPIPS